MTQNQIEDLLSQQADRLAAASPSRPTPPTESSTDGQPSLEQAGLSAEERQSLSSLMRLARRVQSVLVEVEPRPAFVADLKARLVARRRAEMQPASDARWGMMWLWGLAGALSLAGLGILGYRAARAGWMAGRNARLALPKA